MAAHNMQSRLVWPSKYFQLWTFALQAQHSDFTEIIH